MLESIAIPTEILYPILLIVLMPFSFAGVFLIISFVVDRIKVKMGYVKILKITKSFRLKKILSKPVGDKIKLTRKVTVPFINKPPFLAFEGVTPVTFYTSTGKQMNLIKPSKKGEIDPGYFSNLVSEAYNLGILSAIRQDNVVKILMIACIVACIAAAAFGFLNYQILTGA